MKCNIQTLKSCLIACIEADVPAFVHGAPGVGKSDLIRQVAAALTYIPKGEKKPRSYGLVDFRTPARDAVDTRGIPYPDPKTKVTHWFPPNELPQVERDGEFGILFVDEMNAGGVPQAVFSAMLGLVLERRIGAYTLPKGWVPIAAGNRVTDRTGAQKLPTAMRNRFAHFEVEVDPATWCEWAAGAAIHPMALAFIRTRPELLHKMPETDANAFPTPRAWEKVARFVDHPARYPLTAALVGDDVAAEFEAFAGIYKSLPRIEDIFADPDHARIPANSEPSASWAVSAAVARFATRDNFAAGLRYVARLRKEFEIACAVDAVRRDPKLKTTAAYVAWIAANSDVII